MCSFSGVFVFLGMGQTQSRCAHTASLRHEALPAQKLRDSLQAAPFPSQHEE